MQHLTGVQRYVRELSQNLSKELRTLKPDPAWAHGTRGHLWEQFYLPRLCDRRLLWSPGNTGPLSRRNQVVTIHDAATLDCPEWFDRRFATFYGWLLPRLARRVHAIITVSAFSKERLVIRLGVPESRVHVVPNGLGGEFRPQSPPACESVLAQLNLEKPFFLYVGSVEPRKNVGCLLKAWSAASLKEWRLVIAGDRGRIFEDVHLRQDLPGVKFTGRLENRQLSALYSAADVFVSPTVYEGFGFPPLEAMACGCPCLVSDIPPHREVGGEAPVYVAARSVCDWVDALRQAAAWTFKERERRRELGLQIAGRFSWEKSAQGTLAILNSYCDCL